MYKDRRITVYSAQQPRHNIARLMPPSPSSAKSRAFGVMSAIEQRRGHGKPLPAKKLNNETDSLPPEEERTNIALMSKQPRAKRVDLIRPQKGG